MSTSASNVSQKWEDIVFENRNKEYGAYLLRYLYSRNVVISVVVMLFIVGFVISYPAIARYLAAQEEVEDKPAKTVRYTDLAPPPPIDKNVPPPPRLDIPKVKNVIKFLPPKVTDKEVIEEEKMPTIEEIKENEVGAETVEGAGEVIFDEPVESVVEVEDEDKIFTVVEQQAEFSGGLEAMYKFIRNNVKYPATAKRMGVEGSVFVAFVVDRDGGLSTVEVIKGLQADLDKEAVRVVKLMPAWKPGKQNGKAVRSRFVLPIKFKLSQ